MTFNILSKFGIFVVEDFLDAGLCADLRTAASVTAMDQAAVYTKGVIRVDETVRRTKSARIAEPAVSELKARLLDLKPALEAHFNLTLKGCDDPHLLIYREGDFFNPHRDNNRDPKQRRVSIVVFLNRESKEIASDCYGGGSLVFYELMDDPRCKDIGFPVAGKEGLLVAFAADRIHGVLPVTYGERLTLVTWFY
jgi:predicted 2-oxoglutarate/Fe(II)-dependent dioxygenase YbiX